MTQFFAVCASKKAFYSSLLVVKAILLGYYAGGRFCLDGLTGLCVGWVAAISTRPCRHFAVSVDLIAFLVEALLTGVTEPWIWSELAFAFRTLFIGCFKFFRRC